ncbi:hypothetical protein LO80_00240 [Candidatus Francisella endociliophora]|uniref:Uncharacterized protein n=1 Tax=Candidatus Francisella endociliophora TaxID=653937 RepID=A0A097ERQ5_9GAMM|nr:hypothetical protein LO80_00240 [Francisella sp. FSC1006]
MPIEKIYDHNINILIGSGASFGLFPTLAIALDNGSHTIETLATKFDADEKRDLKTLLFMHYYKECIKPVADFNLDDCSTGDQKKVIENYKTFLNTLLTLLGRKNNKKINLFTTNYDGCLPLVANELLKEREFIINDGTLGFQKKYLKASNFNIFSSKTGVFDQYKVDIPQINLINLHGSIYWSKEKESITVDYIKTHQEISVCNDLQAFSNILTDESKKISDVESYTYQDCSCDSESFWQEYNNLPIVNPTKWKFHETVFEEHYYQMLRLMSYELEKPSCVLITFGFSFADEHIENLVKRSLSNPNLQVFICCFNDKEKENMKEKFSQYQNVKYICADEEILDFTKFNSEIFSIGDSNK